MPQILARGGFFATVPSRADNVWMLASRCVLCYHHCSLYRCRSLSISCYQDATAFDRVTQQVVRSQHSRSKQGSCCTPAYTGLQLMIVTTRQQGRVTSIAYNCCMAMKDQR